MVSLPTAGVVVALNLFTATSRAQLAGLEKSTAANLAGLEKSTAALEKSTTANLAGLEKSTAANIAGLKESTAAKIDASNQILYGYTSILDRMTKEASSRQQ